MAYVITCGDEGVQINNGTRLGVIGAGLMLEEFPEVVKYIKKSFGETEEFTIAGSAENDWSKEKLKLDTWEQTNASVQQKVAALADDLGLLYSGFLPFADPRQLKHDIKGHMVRPQLVHIANGISFTLGGGEQIYHLGRFVISADWIGVAPDALVKKVLQTQIDFYQKIVGKEKLLRVIEDTGDLDDKVITKNKAKLEKLGFI